MKVDVYDTYATSTAGNVVHFDVLVPSGTKAEVAFQFARAWLDSIGEKDAELKQSRCNFCHSQNASAAVIADIEETKHHILQMEGCPHPG